MNKNIKQLAEAAGIQFESNKENRIHFISTQTLEKFTEMVVSECYAVCKENLSPDLDGTELGYNDGVGDCAFAIKRHFGVE